MPIKFRKLILVLLDLGCLTLSIFLSFYFCYSSTFYLKEIIPISSFIILPFLIIYYLTGQYNVLTRYVNLGALNLFLFRNSLTSFLIYIFASIFKINLITFPFIFLFWIFINFFKGLLTLLIKDFLRNISSNKFSYRQSRLS